MLILPIRLGDERYALDSAHVIEVIPRVALRKVPHAPDAVAGLLNYRGRIVPVLDLRQLIFGAPCPSLLSTRIVLVEYDHGGSRRTLGLVAERVTEAVRRDPADFAAAGLTVRSAPYLGGVSVDDDGMMQLLRVEHLADDPAIAGVLGAAG